MSETIHISWFKYTCTFWKCVQKKMYHHKAEKLFIIYENLAIVQVRKFVKRRKTKFGNSQIE